MSYEKVIIQILREADPEKGQSLEVIVRNVYNITAIDLFSPRSLEDVNASVCKWLKTEAGFRDGMVEKTPQRGYYRLNKKSQKVTQLLFEFQTAEEDEWML